MRTATVPIFELCEFKEGVCENCGFVLPEGVDRSQPVFRSCTDRPTGKTREIQVIEHTDLEKQFENYPGSLLTKRLEAWGLPPCAACQQTAQQMDFLGPDGVEKHFEEIVDQILTNARSNRSWKVQVFMGLTSDSQKRSIIESAVRKSIDQSRKILEMPASGS